MKKKVKEASTDAPLPPAALKVGDEEGDPFPGYCSCAWRVSCPTRIGSPPAIATRIHGRTRTNSDARARTQTQHIVYTVNHVDSSDHCVYLIDFH